MIFESKQKFNNHGKYFNMLSESLQAKVNHLSQNTQWIKQECVYQMISHTNLN